jgi:H+-transporting ATPase
LTKAVSAFGIANVGHLSLPWWQTLAIFIYAMLSCLVVNDAVKVAMIKWLVPAAAA